MRTVTRWKRLFSFQNAKRWVFLSLFLRAPSVPINIPLNLQKRRRNVFLKCMKCWNIIEAKDTWQKPVLVSELCHVKRTWFVLRLILRRMVEEASRNLRRSSYLASIRFIVIPAGDEPFNSFNATKDVICFELSLIGQQPDFCKQCFVIASPELFSKLVGLVNKLFFSTKCTKVSLYQWWDKKFLQFAKSCDAWKTKTSLWTDFAELKKTGKWESSCYLTVSGSFV